MPQYRAIYEAILSVGGPQAAGTDWANEVAEAAGETLAATVSEPGGVAVAA
nr:hypothetical protein [Demequina litorisediminis]